MNRELLTQHIGAFVNRLKEEPEKFKTDWEERSGLIQVYGGYTKDVLLAIDEDGIFDYMSKLWAMLIWGNKHYVIDKIIEDNGLDNLRRRLAELIWGQTNISQRWDSFRGEIKGMGPATISELLCKTHPDEFMLWNRRAFVALDYLGVDNLPRYDYQLTGEVYDNLCQVCKTIAVELSNAGFSDTTLLAVDYFIWDELQVEDNLSRIHTSRPKKEAETTEPIRADSRFIHNDIRDKLREIGRWLGFESSIEKKVSQGSVVDTVWEATIGNMGRVVYVFEVQTKGSIDSLIVNLLKSLNNPAVQGVVAVSDQSQLDRIRSHADGVQNLRDKLRYWDYEDVARVHESLQYVNESINRLELVPEGF
ncbi:MAG: hypothetical protein OEV49_09395 [candidate division Zixibacteria bacterium]|nr:hypothetical protein [candidate division Zixibacteria bacterium]MDH3936529.1 hypothetical protein [candidate division Zixibacteria bacterium]MDH4033956.1 hypothetical protein [candidate division Zixibacteria bacterium]